MNCIDTIIVHLLDWDKINKEITDKINDGTGYHIGHKWGLIQEPRPCLITDECVAWTPKTKEEKCIELDIYEESKPNSSGGVTFSLLPKASVTVCLSDLDGYLTGETLMLKEFMGRRYGYNARICGNTDTLINWLKRGK